MVHESSVNFKNLIRNLAEMYPFEVGEVVFVELIANALDSRATRISIDYDSIKKILIVTDNGDGMTETQFDEYHDFAAGLKRRGDCIGFAGVGAKISFNIADRVITETRSDSFSGGSDWYLKTNKKLIWEETSPAHLKKGNGTRIEVRFRTDPPYSDRNGLVKLLKRHYFPLIERQFLTLYSQTKFYSSDLRFVVNGVEIEPVDVKTDLGLEEIKVFFPMKGKKRIGFGILGLSKKRVSCRTECVRRFSLYTWESH